MQIRELRALRGPNIWSRYQTIFMLLDLEEMEDRPSAKVPGFHDRLVSLVPTLVEHRCSLGVPGGFLSRIQEGTWMGHIVEHVAIELQCLSGMEVGFGKTRETLERGVYNIVFRFRTEEAGLEAGRLAVTLVQSVVADQPFDIDAAIHTLMEIREDRFLGPSTRCIVKTAFDRGIPYFRLNRQSFVQLGWGVNQQRIQATMTARTSALGVEIADEKDRTKRILEAAGIPVPAGIEGVDWEDTLAEARELGYPLVIKPLVGNHGRGITVGIENETELRTAWEAARRIHDRVLVERQLIGDDYRLLVIDHKLVAAACRTPALVVGDGKSTVQQLVDTVNADPQRGFGHNRILTQITIDDQTHRLMALASLTLESVLPAGQEFRLKTTSNLSTGGTAADVFDTVHPDNRYMAERISRLAGLDIVGIDVVTPTLVQPVVEVGGGIVEINAAPGFRMHLSPSSGTPRNVGEPVVDMLFPPGTPTRIPVVAVTGTNGKTTTVRLISYILKHQGHHVGMTSTDGVWLRERCILKGDYSGPTGARVVLEEPSIDFAVLEVARGGIIRRGLGFDEAHCAVILNVAEDHLGQDGVHDLDDLTRVKEVVADAVSTSGFAVLNAQDERVMSMGTPEGTKRLLFSLDPADATFAAHIAAGGTGVCVQDDHIVIQDAGHPIPVALVEDIPLTLDGRAVFNILNVLAATAVAHGFGINIEAIRGALLTFNPSVTQNPGRLNLFTVGAKTVLIDYAHNIPALKSLQAFITRYPHRRRKVVFGGTGNRRDEDIIGIGELLGSFYQQVYLDDADPRGREPGEVPRLVREGLLKAGLDPGAISEEADETTMVAQALQELQDGDLLHIQVDDITGVVAAVKEWRHRLTDGDQAHRNG